MRVMADHLHNRSRFAIGLSDYYLMLLSLILFGYALIGKGFAYVGFPPLFVGEIALLIGTAVLLRTGCFVAVLATLPGLLLAITMAWMLMRTLPFIDVYGADALRDSVVLMYGAFAFIIIAVLLEDSSRIQTLLRYYGAFATVFVPAIPFVFAVSRFLPDYVPKLAGYGVPVLGLRAGEVSVHLAGAAAFALGGFRTGTWLWVIPLFVALAMAVTSSRAAILAFFPPVLFAALLLGKVRHIVVILVSAAVVLGAAYAAETIMFSGQREAMRSDDRAFSARQFIKNTASIVGAPDDSLEGTKAWRLDWWNVILNDTVYGSNFWTGSGFGLNLSNEYGFPYEKDVQDRYAPPLRSPHNVHMTILARAGVPGVVLWFMFLASWLSMILKAILTAQRHGQRDWAGLFAFTTCYALAIIINASFDVALEGPMLGIWFWCLIGFGIGSVMTYRALDFHPTRRDRGISGNVPVGSRLSIARSLAAPAAIVLPLATTPFIALPSATAAEPGVSNKPCPPSAIPVAAGASIQDAVDRAGDGAVFCLKNGTHRMQAVRPRQGQSFHGEGRTVLNGSRLITEFIREGRYWVVTGQPQRGRKHGECLQEAPACDLPEGFFIDDMPLIRVLTKEQVKAGRFHLDYGSGKLYFADDPTGRRVEATVAAFAFKSEAGGVLIANVTVEKYASPAQSGAIQAGDAQAWSVENCELRLNNGLGLYLGTSGRVRLCDVHHNGQMGIGGVGRDIRIEQNRIWANNTRGFNVGWEGGGVKITNSDGVVFHGNHVYDNVGSGLWCDINCRNVVYEGNLVENNQWAGIFHEISFNAIIRNNVVRHNSLGKRRWFWGADILVAASQGVEARANILIVSPGGCGIVLIDQSRAIQRVDQGRVTEGPGKYKTRDNTVHHNEITFEGSACGGGASDAWPGDENFSIISDGNNRFDANVYRVPHTRGRDRFVWGHSTLDWDGLRRIGLELNGQLVLY
jgi:Right handed beta helix region/O-Antigen ligase